MFARSFVAIAKGDGCVMQVVNAKRWQGILGGELTVVRRTIAVIFSVLVVAMVAAQQSFFPLGDAHVILLLVPIALSSLLLGKWQGCAIGALAGTAEMGHSIFLPYDFYEAYFSSPLNSIVLFALFGLLMGALFALACRLPRRSHDGEVHSRGQSPSVHAQSETAPDCASKGLSRGIARKLAIVGACAVGVLFATAFLQIGITLLNTSFGVSLPLGMAERLLGVNSSLSQVALDLLAVGFFAVASDIVTPRLSSIERKRSVRVTFQIWLGIITITFFFVASGLSFAAITLVDLGNTDVALSDHLDKLSSELSKRDSLMTAVDDHVELSHKDRRTFEKLIYDSLDCDLSGWLEDTVVVANDGEIFSSNVEGLKGTSFSEFIESGLVGESLDNILSSGKTHMYYAGSGAQISYIRGNELSYEYFDENGNSNIGSYQIAVIVTARETFLHRWLFMVMVGIVFAVLLGTISALMLKLVDIVIVRPIDKTNVVLKRITEGKLAERVPDSNSLEFASLSDGINATVSALEDSIAEANARIDRELATARAIQEGALPSSQPPFPNIDTFDLYATMNPAREVGGDFYDFFELNRERIGFVVADVSGKGIPAALFMMSAKMAIHGAMEAKADLAKAINIANRSLCKGNDSEMFVTAFAGVLEYRTGKLTYVNAGHNKPLVMHDGKWSWLEERSGPYLGSFDWVEYKKFEMQLQPGDELFVYTDGVTEAFSADGKLYGNARLEAFLTSHAKLHPRRLLRALRADLIGWSVDTEQSDDITMLGLKFGIPPEHGASLITTADLGNFEQVEAFIMQHLEETGCPPKSCNHVLIAVEELVVNVCNYAYPDAGPDDPRPLRVHYTWQTDPNAVVIEIGDDGMPFNPLEHEDPEKPESIEEAKIGGLGLFMTKKLMDEIEYVREGIANVTIITKRWE